MRASFAISVVLRVSYGRRIQSLDDPIVVANTKIEECKYVHITEIAI